MDFGDQNYRQTKLIEKAVLALGWDDKGRVRLPNFYTLDNCNKWVQSKINFLV